MKPRAPLLALLLITALPFPATAASERVLVAALGASKVLVRRSDKAMSDGGALLSARADASLVIPLVACAPASGARVVVSDGGFFSSAARWLPRHRVEPASRPVELSFTRELPRELVERLSAAAIREGGNPAAVVVRAALRAEVSGRIRRGSQLSRPHPPLSA